MTITLSDFKGISNKANINRLPEQYLSECVNFNIDNSGILSQRGGYSEKTSGEFTALWSDEARCFAVKDGDLVEVNSDYSVSVLRAGIGRVHLDFCECNGRYYYVGNRISGIIDEQGVKSFGLDCVPIQPSLTAQSGGALSAGVYQVAITLLDDAGVESGTVAPELITVADGQAIQLSNMLVPRDARACYVAVYMSAPNGGELYRQGVVSVGTPVVIIAQIDINSHPLNSIGIMPAPVGQLIAYFYGHLVIASGNYLYYSEKFQHERWNPAKNYPYPSKITAIMPCENGLWIGTESSGLFWIMGKTPRHGMDAPGDFIQAKKHHACVYQGSPQRVEADVIGQPTHGWIATAKEGLFLLLDQGQFANVTFDNIKLPEFLTCASAIVSNDDSFNYLAIIKGAKVPKRSI